MKLYTAKEVAKKLDLSPDSMRHYAVRYKVGTKLGRDWLFTDDVKIIKMHQGKIESPKKKKNRKKLFINYKNAKVKVSILNGFNFRNYKFKI